MPRLPLLALLIAALVAPVGAAPGASPVAGPAATDPVEVNPDSPRVLLLEGENRTGSADPDLDVASAVEMGRSSLAATFDQYRFEEQFAQAQTDEQRRAAVRSALDRLERDVTELRTEERDARRAVLAGERSLDSYVELLGRLHADAQALDAVAQSVASHADRIGAADLRRQARSVQAELVPYRGDTRSLIATAVRSGSGASTFAWVAETGFALSDRRGETFHREAFRPPALDDPDAQQSYDRLLEIAEQLYPTTQRQSSRFSILFYTEPAAYGIVFELPDGRIQSYVDSSTEQVFYEARRTVPVESAGPIASNSTENVTLSVSRSYPGGPMWVNATNATGAPLDASVTVNGTAVGTTGSDGTLWTMAPGEPVTVAATHDGERVTVVARPVWDRPES